MLDNNLPDYDAQAACRQEPDRVLLQPRYRRLLSVGGLLDEAIQLFRQHWLTFALFSLVSLIPSWLFLMLTYATGFYDVTPRAPLPTLAASAAFLVLSVFEGLFGALWTAASSVAAAEVLSGQQPELVSVYRRALQRLPVLIGGTIVLVFLFVVLTLASTALFVVTLFGTLGTLIALVGLYVWWQKPERRKPWLKWLIVLTAPYGLVTYYFVRWSLYVPAVVLEQRGPVGSMQRSSELVEHQWFRAGAVLTLASLIVLVLIAVPAAILEALLAVFGVVGSPFQPDPSGSMITNSASILAQVLFSSLATITYVLLYVDLRNRREGTDLQERISSLEGASA